MGKTFTDWRFPRCLSPRSIAPGLGAALLLAAALLFAQPVRAAESLLLAVHPYLSSFEIIQRFQPLADFLGEVTERPVTVSVSRDYASHIDRIVKGQVDFAYMGPAAYVALSTSGSTHQLLARLSIMGRPNFHGYIVTRSDSGIRALADLKGKNFAFGDVNSTMSHMIPYAMMLQAGVAKDDLGKHDFVGSHENVALSVLAGVFDAGAVKEEVYNKFKDKGLASLSKSPAISEHLFVATSRVSARTTDTVRAALLSIDTTPGGRKIVQGIKKTVTGLVPVQNSHYESLRQLMDVIGEGK